MTSLSSSGPPPVETHRPAVGIALLVAAGFFLTGNDATVKWVTSTLPVGEIIAIRGTISVLIIAVYAWAVPGLKTLWAVDVKGQAVRASAMLASIFLYVSGLQFLQLVDQVAASFTTPFFIALLAFPILSERVGWHRWMAISIGFAGTVILLRPSAEGIHWAILLPLGAALTSALRDVVTRRISVTETSLSILFHTSLLEVAGGLATLPFGWVMPNTVTLALLGLAAVLFFAAQLLTIEAFRNARAAVIAPYRYALIVWGTLFGFVIWGDLPDVWTLIGGAVIVGGGLCLYIRETKERTKPRES